MVEARKLLTVAKLLVGTNRKGAPSQASLRRAVSTAYYALFHALVGAAADLFVGRTKRSTPRYTTVYRAFDHRRMREGSEAIDKPVLAAKAKNALGVAAAQQELRDVASAFVTLQQRRHWADYAPTGSISRSDAQDLVGQAELAIAQLKAADADQRANWLAFLLTSTRE
jgi:uncharacterized protein (UPF0332 family)